jgi:hypothetical protein
MLASEEGMVWCVGEEEEEDGEQRQSGPNAFCILAAATRLGKVEEAAKAVT